MVPIGSFDHLGGHADEAAYGPSRLTGAHKPRDACVAECVRGDRAVEAGTRDGAAEGFGDALNRLVRCPWQGDHVKALRQPFPAFEMRQELVGYWCRRFALGRLALARCRAEHEPMVQVEVSAVRMRTPAERQDRAGAGSCAQSDQDELGEVAVDGGPVASPDGPVLASSGDV